MHHQEDHQLVQKLINKDSVAFKVFFDTYFPRLYRFCYGRMGELGCEDVVQESLIKAVKGLESYRGEASLFTWLCQICRNETVNWYRKNGGERTVSLDDNDDVRAILETMGAEDANALEDDLSLERIVQLTLDYLPPKYSRVLEMKYLEGLSVTEMSAMLETGELAIQSMLARARKAFRTGYRDLQLGGQV